MNPNPIPTGLDNLLVFLIDTLRVRGVHYQVMALLIVLGISVLLSRFGPRYTLAAGHLLFAVAKHFILSAVLVFVIAFTLFSARTILTGQTITPMSADEYGYLLTADTFRHGRLTNPPHPLWKHFENFYILQQPTYNSKYFPAQGMAIAAGWALLGHPTHGVRLSGALACVAILWMLGGWFDKRWALFGALIAVTSFVIFDWNQTYLGGNVALSGGALCLGAFMRITTQKPHIRNPVLLGVGMAILANSRPFEGLVFSLCLGAFLLRWALTEGRRRLGLAGIGKRVVTPLAVVMGLNFCWIGVYDHAVTGDTLTFPYALYLKQYEATPIGLLREPRVPLSPTCTMREYNERFVAEYRRFHTFEVFAIVESQRLAMIAVTLVSITCLPFFALGLYDLLKNGKAFIPLIISISIIGSSLTFGFLPQYIAHVAPAMLIVTVHGIRSVWASGTRNAELWRLIAVLTPVGQLIAILLFVGKQELAASTGKSAREEIENDLRSRAGHHLVVVRDSCASANWGFVYNEANIDASKIVWARELGSSEDEALLKYFASRQAWLLEVEGGKAKIRPFSREP